MSETTFPPPAPPPAASSAVWDELDARLDLASDWVSPILVKEARQSLKSLQFLITFTLVLIAAWTWSFMPLEDHSDMSGGTMRLFGYFVILAFPLLVVVPFLSFRSLAVEREDGTYELLTVTSLTPDQIILGKLGSVLVQMATYVSAVAPCITFTYLLPGNDLGSISLVLANLIVGGIALSALALLFATATRNRYWQMILSGLVVIGLVFILFWSLMGVSFFLSMGRYAPHAPSQPTNWELFFICAGFEVLGTLLFVQGAASRIASGGENFATRVRFTLLVIQAYFVAVMAYVALREASVPAVSLILGAHFWGVCGALMMGESDEIAPRAQRGLPTSFLGRLVFGWLYPGAASGYFCVLASFACLTVATTIQASLWAAYSGPPIFRQPEDVAFLGGYLAAVIAFQLGVGRALFLFADRVRVGLSSAWPSLIEWHMGPVESLLIHLLMTILFCSFSFCIGVFSVFNPWWMIGGPQYYTNMPSGPELFLSALPWAVPFIVWQVIAARGMVLAERLAPPERVVEDDQTSPASSAPELHRSQP